jgi:HlyD family secretion protein
MLANTLWTSSAIFLVPFLAALLAACGAAPEVDIVRPKRGELRESFAEPAKTRLANTYRITMPVAGRIGRIALEPGAAVKAGQTLATFDLLPLEQTASEASAAVAELEQQIVVNEFNQIEQHLATELRATVEATRQTLKATDAQVDAEQARVERADKELRRLQQLIRHQTVSQQDLDDATLAAETATIALRKQQFYKAALATLFTAIELGPQYIDEWLSRKTLQREVIVQQLTQARARLVRAEHDVSLAKIRSPIDGLVLERYHLGDATLPAGELLLLLGNLEELEVVAEVLTADALQLHPGSRISLDPGPRHQALGGAVKRIEPAGFTKLSSLGVEQQRVRVIVAFEAIPAYLGVGYRLQARFFTGIADDALIVPRFSVLQAPDQSYFVFKVADGKLEKQAVQLGLSNDLELEIRAGLGENDVIVATPDTALNEGDRVEVRGQ